MKKISMCLITLTVATLITACDSPRDKAEKIIPPVIETSTNLNQYPTRDRVDYVLNCIAKQGGLTYIAQYACGCKIDKIAEKLTFEEFEAATTFGYMRKTPGENGAAFRDPEQSKILKKSLQIAEMYAKNKCFVK